MATCGLFERKIADMPEQAADRGSEHVEDAERRQERLAAQNQRSWTVTVSPGRTLK